MWIGVFEGNGRDNGDNGEGAVRFSQMRAEAVYQAMLQRIQNAYCISSQAVQVSRRLGIRQSRKAGPETTDFLSS